MPPPARSAPPPAPLAGLCDSCRHQQVVGTTRGSAFSLCRRHRTEPHRYPKYPRLPVAECGGWQPRGPAVTPPGPY